MVARIWSTNRVWLAIAALVALLQVGGCIGGIPDEVTGTLVFDCEEARRMDEYSQTTCSDMLPSNGYVSLVDVTGVQLDNASYMEFSGRMSYAGIDDKSVVRMPENRVVSEGIVTGPVRTSPVPFSIELDPQRIDPEGDYIVVARFHDGHREPPFLWSALYRSRFDGGDPPTFVLTKGNPHKDVVVPLIFLGWRATMHIDNYPVNP